MPGPKPLSIEERFWRAVIITQDGCWGWNLSKAGYGYGIIQIKCRREGIRYNIYAHRYSWELHNGPIPIDLNVLHKCDNPICSNPEHLFLGTQSDNIRDCVKKGRLTRKSESYIGEKNSQVKLTWDQVNFIRNSNLKSRELTSLLLVTKTTINSIKRGKTRRYA